MVEKYRCESYIHFGINLLPGSNMIKKNSLVCVQIQTLTSLCKNSTSYLHVIFFFIVTSLFQVLDKSDLFFAGGPIFPDNHTRNVLFPFFNLCTLL